jgi:outer membrane protein assembly factor BamB
MTLFALGFGLAASACRDAATDPAVGPDSVVASIEMLPSQRALSYIGMTDRMGARRVAADGSFLGGSHALPERFSWSSDAPDVVTVDSLGVVTALSEGRALITATSAGVKGTATVTVRDAIRLAWSSPLDGSPGALTVGDDGTIYMSGAGTLHALAPGGQHRWSVHTGAPDGSVPAIAADGTLYVGTFGNNGSVMAIDRSGAVRWTLEDTGLSSSSPVVGADGTLYAIRPDSTLYAIDPIGQTRWQFRAAARFTSSPALTQDGTVLIGSYGRLYAVGTDGMERWTFPTGGAIRSSPAIAFDGTIYFTSEDQHLYAVTTNGGLKWRLPLPLGDQALWSPAIGTDGTVYISGDEGLNAVDPSGRLRWTYRGTNPRSGTMGFGTPIVAGDGTIYVAGLGRHHVFALAADGSLRWDYPAPGPIFRVPAIGLDGMILAASSGSSSAESGILYAIVELDGSNGGFASAPWPKARGDRANTGRAGGR